MSTSSSSLNLSTLSYDDCDSGNTSIDDGPDFGEYPTPVFHEIYFDAGPAYADVLASKAHKQYMASAALLKSSSDVLQQICQLLNDLVDVYCEHYTISSTRAIRFVNHSQAALLHHPRKSTTVRPQLIAVPHRVAESWEASKDDKSFYLSAIAWHHVAAAVHIDTGDYLHEQCADCLGALNQARPDLPGCFSLMATRKSCRIVWSDPAGLCTSSEFPWSEPATLLSLLGFIHRLHHPLLVDPSIRLESAVGADDSNAVPGRGSNDQHSRRPVWLVEDNSGTVYRATTLLGIGAPWTRQSWVVAATEHRPAGAADFTPCPRTVVKDSWPMLANEPACEDAVLEHIHADAVVPGVCRVLSSFLVPRGNGHVRTVAAEDAGRNTRRKHRLVLDGTSKDLYACSSVVEFLTVMYDVLEVLKRVHERCGVLHRDVSIRNILCNRATDYVTSEDAPKFAHDVLAYKYSGLRAGPTCTLIDFDNAFWEGRTPKSSLRMAVGTPTFASRAASRAFDFWDGRPLYPIRALDGSARECYINAFGEARYNEIFSLRQSRKVCDMDNIPADRAVFSPWHDAESCFWVILHFLLTALPAGADPGDDDTHDARRICGYLESHEIGKTNDMRHVIFSIRCSVPAQGWPRLLHRSLSSLGDFIRLLTIMVEPTFEHFEPPLPPYYLHDVMQRMLLHEICRIMDADADIPLDVSRRRALQSSFANVSRSCSSECQSPARSSKKRRREPVECDGESCRRRRLS